MLWSTNIANTNAVEHQYHQYPCCAALTLLTTTLWSTNSTSVSAAEHRNCHNDCGEAQGKHTGHTQVAMLTAAEVDYHSV